MPGIARVALAAALVTTGCAATIESDPGPQNSEDAHLSQVADNATYAVLPATPDTLAGPVSGADALVDNALPDASDAPSPDVEQDAALDSGPGDPPDAPLPSLDVRGEDTGTSVVDTADVETSPADVIDTVPTDCAELADGVLCDDGDPCTLEDLCLDAECVGTPLDCTDQDPCTTDETCMDGTCQATNLPDGKSCDGADGCTFEGTCNLGVCEPKEPLCETDDPCKVGSCVDEECVYQNVPNFTSCDDSDPCTTFDRCISGFCYGSPKSCQDGEPCTLDSCEAGTGECLSEPMEGCVPGTPTDFTSEDVNPYSATFGDDVSLQSFADKLLLIVFHSPS